MRFIKKYVSSLDEVGNRERRATNDKRRILGLRENNLRVK